jgi:catechol 2,3-dioxygenase-like lactoylglutathione lyase family enzyme
MSTIQPVILTADQDVLLHFYTKLFGAEEIFRVPEEGPAFYRGLRIGDTDLGRLPRRTRGPGRRHGSCSASVSTTSTRRSVAWRLWTARSAAAPTTCRGDSASPTFRTLTATR